MPRTHEPGDLVDLVELDPGALGRPGRHAPPGTARSVRFAVHLTPAEAADWRRIAEGWDVAVPVALWAVLTTQLARWRRRAPHHGPAGLAIAAAAWTLGWRPGRPRKGQPDGT